MCYIGKTETFGPDNPPPPDGSIRYKIMLWENEAKTQMCSLFQRTRYEFGQELMARNTGERAIYVFKDLDSARDTLGKIAKLQKSAAWFNSVHAKHPDTSIEAGWVHPTKKHFIAECSVRQFGCADYSMPRALVETWSYCTPLRVVS